MTTNKTEMKLLTGEMRSAWKRCPVRLSPMTLPRRVDSHDADDLSLTSLTEWGEVIRKVQTEVEIELSMEVVEARSLRDAREELDEYLSQ